MDEPVKKVRLRSKSERLKRHLRALRERAEYLDKVAESEYEREKKSFSYRMAERNALHWALDVIDVTDIKLLHRCLADVLPDEAVDEKEEDQDVEA